MTVSFQCIGTTVADAAVTFQGLRTVVDAYQEIRARRAGSPNPNLTQQVIGSDEHDVVFEDHYVDRHLHDAAGNPIPIKAQLRADGTGCLTLETFYNADEEITLPKGDTLLGGETLSYVDLATLTPDGFDIWTRERHQLGNTLQERIAYGLSAPLLDLQPA